MKKVTSIQALDKKQSLSLPLVFDLEGIEKNELLIPLLEEAPGLLAKIKEAHKSSDSISPLYLKDTSGDFRFFKVFKVHFAEKEALMLQDESKGEWHKQLLSLNDAFQKEFNQFIQNTLAQKLEKGKSLSQIISEELCRLSKHLGFPFIRIYSFSDESAIGECISAHREDSTFKPERLAHYHEPLAPSLPDIVNRSELENTENLDLQFYHLETEALSLCFVLPRYKNKALRLGIYKTLSTFCTTTVAVWSQLYPIRFSGELNFVASQFLEQSAAPELIFKSCGTVVYFNDAWGKTFPKQAMFLEQGIYNHLRGENLLKAPRRGDLSAQTIKIKGHTYQLRTIQPSSRLSPLFLIHQLDDQLGLIPSQSHDIDAGSPWLKQEILPFAEIEIDSLTVKYSNRLFHKLSVENKWTTNDVLKPDCGLSMFISAKASNAEDNKGHETIELHASNKVYRLKLEVFKKANRALVFCVDETEVHLLKEEQTKLRKLFQKIQRGAKIGFYAYDLESGEGEWSPYMHQLFPNQEGVEVPNHLDLIHADDKQKVNDIYELALAGELDFYARYRITGLDNETRFLEDRNELIRDDNGNAFKIVGYLRDISSEQEHKLSSLLGKQKLLDLDDLIQVNHTIERIKESDFHSDEAFKKLSRALISSKLLGVSLVFSMQDRDEEKLEIDFISGLKQTGSGSREVPLKKTKHFLNREVLPSTAGSMKLRRLHLNKIKKSSFLYSIIGMEKDLEAFAVYFPNEGQGHKLLIFTVKNGKDLTETGKSILLTGFKVFQQNQLDAHREQGLKENRESLQLLNEHAGIDLFDYNLSVKTIKSRVGQRSLIGLENEELSLKELLDKHIHPDDQQSLLMGMDQLEDGQRQKLIMDLRLRNGADSYFVKLLAKAIPGADGQPYKIIGSLSDRSASVKSNRLLKQIYEQAKVAPLSINLAEARLAAPSQLLADLLECSLKALNKTFESTRVFNPKNRQWETMPQALNAIKKSSAGHWQITVLVKLPNSKEKLLKFNMNRGSEPHAFFRGVVQDISDLREKSIRLTERSKLLKVAQKMGGIGIFYYSEREGELTLDPSLRVLLGIPPKLKLNLRNFAAIFEKGFEDILEEYIVRTLKGQSLSSTLLKIKYAFKPDEHKWCSFKTELVSKRNQLIVVGLLQDIDLVKQLEDELHHLSFRVKKATWYQSHKVKASLSKLRELKEKLATEKADVKMLQKSHKLLEAAFKDMEQSVAFVNNTINFRGIDSQTGDGRIFSPHFLGIQRDKNQVVHVVDDDSVARSLHAEMLKKKGLPYPILFSSNGKELLKRIADLKDNYHLVFLDLEMPGMSGNEVLNELMQGKYPSHRIKIIVISASLSNEEISEALSHPLVSHFEEKPLSLDKLDHLPIY